MAESAKYAMLAGGLLVGSGTTYLLTKRYYEKKYREFAEAEIASVREAFKADLVQENEDEILKETIIMNEEVAEQNRKTPPTDEELEKYAEEAGQYGHRHDQEYTQNPDAPDPTTWDRSLDRPYVITVDEYMIDNQEDDKVSLKYYEGDDTLADEDDQPIEDVEGTVGMSNLMHFGVGSNDVNFVHIRNPFREVDFEIKRIKDSYKRAVLGEHDEEDKYPHADDIEQPVPKVRKMKKDHG